MTSKLKSIFKRQVSQPVRNDVENTEESSAIMKNAPAEFIRQRRDDNSSSLDVRENGKNEKSIALRRKNGTKRHNTSLGAIEDLLQCPICKDRLKSPRMMPCQHTFCEKCLEKQLNQPSDNNALSCPLCDLRVTDRTPDLLPTNLYIESLLRVMENPGDGWIRLASKNPVVSFAPLPERIVDSEIIRAAPRSPGSPNLCIKCAIDCSKENKCGHCKQIFCPNCWTIHTNELKEQLENFLLQMETISTRFEKKIEEFRSKVDNFKDSIEKDIESRIAELMQEREERMKKLSCQLNRGEEAAKEIQRRINEAADDLKEQTDALSETLLDNNAKGSKISCRSYKVLSILVVVTARIVAWPRRYRNNPIT